MTAEVMPKEEVLRSLYAQYQSLNKEDENYKESARKLRSKIRQAGGSVRALNQADSVEAALQVDVSELKNAPRTSTGSSSDSDEQRAKRKARRNKKNQVDVSATPASEAEVQTIVDALIAGGLTQVTLEQLEKSQKHGLGQDLHQGVSPDSVMQTYNDRFPGVTAEWFCLHQSTIHGAPALLLIGPVPTEALPEGHQGIEGEGADPTEVDVDYDDESDDDQE